MKKKNLIFEKTLFYMLILIYIYFKKFNFSYSRMLLVISKFFSFNINYVL